MSLENHSHPHGTWVCRGLSWGEVWDRGPRGRGSPAPEQTSSVTLSKLGKPQPAPYPRHRRARAPASPREPTRQHVRSACPVPRAHGGHAPWQPAVTVLLLASSRHLSPWHEPPLRGPYNIETVP